MRGGRVAIGVVTALLLSGAQTGSALACSCAPSAPADSLRAADAAIVGRLLKVEPRGPARAEYRYRVVRVYRGRGEVRGGSVVTVRSGRDSAGCALPTRVGRSYGLFLLGERGRWAGGLCGVISPRRLWAASRGSRDAAGSAGPLSSCAS